MTSPEDRGAEIIEYCIKSSYLEREDLLLCQENDQKLKPLWKEGETAIEKNEGQPKEMENEKAAVDMRKEEQLKEMEERKEKFKNSMEKWTNDLKEEVKEEIKKRQDEWRKEGKISSEKEELRKHVIFNDSVHKSIELNSLEVAIVNTREFSRMRNIKQLGGASYVYPGAVHTRFEHSIGVCHLAGVFADKLKTKMKRCKKFIKEKLQDQKNFKEDFCMKKNEKQCIRIAALCHDLGHGPFSHMFERFRNEILEEQNKIIKHEEMSILIFKQILSTNMKVLSEFVASGLSWEDVWKIEFMIHPDMEQIKSKKKFLFEIVANKSSGLDVDKWDYYARDCHYLGIQYEYDYGRTMELSNIILEGEDYHIGFRRKEVDNIYRMFRTRTVLHQKAYSHKVVDAVEIMITDALSKVKDVKTIIPSWDESLNDILKDFTTTPLNKLRRIDKYIDLTDNIVTLIKLARKDESNPQAVDEAQKTLMALEKRELLKCCTEVVVPSRKTCDKDDEYKDQAKWMKDNYKFIKTTIERAVRDQRLQEPQIKIPKISYASEASANPVNEIYFFEDDKDLPHGEKIKEEEPVSLLNTPHTFLEYRVRVYCKEKDEGFDEKGLKKMLTTKIAELWKKKAVQQN